VRHGSAFLLVLVACLAPAHAASATVRNFNVDAAHTSELRDATLRPPIGRKWIRRDLGGVGQPLIADRRAFVRGGAGVAALERDTGRTLWERDASPGELAYADGLLFYVTDLRLTAVDAATGVPRWERQLTDDESVTGAPTVDAGVVYVGDGNTMHAFRASDGAVQWSSSAEGAAEGAPAVDRDHVYSVGGCAETTALERLLGLRRWRYVGDCTGAGGGTPMIHGGRVFATDDGHDGVILDAASGRPQGTFSGWPSRAGDLLLLTTSAGIVAQDDSGRVAWRYARTDTFATPFLPLTVGGIVWLREGDVLFGLDARTGGVVQRVEPVPSAFTSSTQPSAAPIASDGEWLVISGQGRVAGLAGGADAPGIDDPDKPRADEIVLTLRANRRLLKGLSGGATLHAERERPPGSDAGAAELDDVELQADPYPYDDRWQPVARMIGWFDEFRVDPGVNTRYRLLDLSTVPQAASRVVEIRVDFDIAFTLRAVSPRAIRATVWVEAPPGVRMAGRRVYMYRLPRGAKRGIRIRVLRLRASRPRGRYRAAARLPLRGLRRTDRLFVCFRNPMPGAVGRPVRGPDPCGRRRV
jgi:outer membrane protein assembly factor BamB